MTWYYWILVGIAKPFAALLLFGVICLSARYAVIWFIPEGKLKRFLLIDASGNPKSRGVVKKSTDIP